DRACVLPVRREGANPAHAHDRARPVRGDRRAVVAELTEAVVAPAADAAVRERGATKIRSGGNRDRAGHARDDDGREPVLTTAVTQLPVVAGAPADDGATCAHGAGVTLAGRDGERVVDS